MAEPRTPHSLLDWRRSCSFKLRYETKPAAVRAALISRRRGSVRLQPYECDWCGGWHLTKRDWSKPKRDREVGDG